MVAIRDAAPPPGALATASSARPPACDRLPGPRARARGRRLRLVPSGIEDVRLRRVAVRGGRLRHRTVRRLAGVAGARVVRARGLRDGLYVVRFRSGEGARRVVVRRRLGRFHRVRGRLDLATSCARASLSGPLFARGGLRVRVVPVQPGAGVRIVARRVGHSQASGVRPDRVRGRSRVRARLRLAPGTWHVAVAVGGRHLGTLVARRPR